MRRTLPAIIATWLVASSAQGEPAPASAASSEQSSQEAEAREHYARAIKLYDAGQLRAALSELERAYELSASYRILYNIALVNLELRDDVAALTAFEAYLEQGGSELGADRIVSVRKEVEQLTKRVGQLYVEVDIQGAHIFVDEVLAGTAPLARPVRVNAGLHRVRVKTPDGRDNSKSLDVRQGESKVLVFALELANPPVTPVPVQGDTSSEGATSVPWLAWTLTGVFAVGVGVSGVLALEARSEERELKRQVPVRPEQLATARRQVERLALVTDLFLGATVIAGGASLYLTLQGSKQDTTHLQLTVLPGGMQLGGTF